MTVILPGARRGLAFLAAAGVPYPTQSPSPRRSASPCSPAAGAALLQTDNSPQIQKNPRKRGADPSWLQQPLPKKLAVYKDMFGAEQETPGVPAMLLLYVCIGYVREYLRVMYGEIPLPFLIAVALQSVYGLIKNRGGRATFQTIKPAVEDACSRRFTVIHWGLLLVDTFVGSYGKERMARGECY